MTIQQHPLRHPSHAATPPGFRLERWQRRALYVSIVLLTASGLLWLAAHFFLRPVTEFGESISPLEPWAMKLHGAGTMALLFMLGTMLNSHIRRALRGNHNVVSGWAIIAALLLLTATGYGLYYLAGENSRNIWSWSHWIIGIALACALPLHIALGRKCAHQRNEGRAVH